jgi:hypothetical protein
VPQQLPAPLRALAAAVGVSVAPDGHGDAPHVAEAGQPGGSAHNAHGVHGALTGHERWLPYKHVNGVAIYHNEVAEGALL